MLFNHNIVNQLYFNKKKLRIENKKKNVEHSGHNGDQHPRNEQIEHVT